MKLIEALVQELPRRGGWPEGVEEIWQDYDKMMRPLGWFHDELCEDHRRQHYDAHVKINRKQYESALAASKPEWDGEGLPPVGCRVEANYGGEWVEATVAYIDRPEAHGDAVAWKEALVFDCKTTRPFWADEFRPIHSEADKKRDETIEAMHDFYRNSLGDNRNAICNIYDAITAGKIPHIRID